VPTPRRVGDESTTWLDVHMDGWATACAVRSDHTLWCWGYNHHGQLGIGVQDAPEDPPRQMTQVGSDTDWAEVRVAVPVTCAIKVDRSLWCWGANNNGQSGSGASEEPATSPRRVAGEREWADVTPSGAFVCGTTTDARAWCWGGNARGSLGDGTLDDRTEPTAVMGEHRWRDLTVTGTAATCGIDTDGALWCWGPHQGYFGNVVRRRDPAPVGPTTPSP
jgi:alpha-tubulin suppressor-like RCC1 family protein